MVKSSNISVCPKASTGGALSGVYATGQTIELQNTERENDLKKYWYYEGLEYSEGSRLEQVGVLQICKRVENGYLAWTNSK